MPCADSDRDFKVISDALQNMPHHLLPHCRYEYKGGAKYYGDIVNFKRQGRGIMTYPDGDLYEGCFSEGVKEGHGTQKWLDGSVYQGPFKQGKRHGRGVHQWSNGETYEGEYEEDKRCGEGTYTWPDKNKFVGNFRNGCKQGLGTFYSANGNTFQGQYSKDDRLGAGVMKYTDSTEDRGFWKGCALLKLDTSVLPASVLDIADKKPESDMCDMREVTKGFKVVSRDTEAKSPGRLETASEALLLAALKGDSAAVVYLLQHTCVRPDIADCNGLTPLHAASVFCKKKVVNILLDNGANVNQLTESGISPLVACHLHMYCNTHCGYDIQNRLAPLEPCDKEEELEGPIEAFEQLQLSTALNMEDEYTLDGSSIKFDAYEHQVPNQGVDKGVSVVASTISEPQGGNHTTVVVHGKRYFVQGEEVLKNLELPAWSTLPTQEQLRDTIRLLLKRGADPKIGTIPVPALILAIIARDVEAVELLLQSGADPTSRVGSKYGHKSPLHVAAGLLGPGAPAIVELLLRAGADPNVRDDLSFSRTGALQWKLVEETDEEGNLMGSTPLQVACSMDEGYEYSIEVIKLLLKHGADTNVVCSGHSPLTLAIYSGNDKGVEILLKNENESSLNLAIDHLLDFGANPSLPLGAPIGSALCAAVDTAAEHRRSNEQRLAVINQLIHAGGDIMALVPVGKSGKHHGTAVDYAMHVFYQDKRIAHTPFHALTPNEREIYIARTTLLNHMATLLRDEVQKRERKLKKELGEEELNTTGKRNQKPKMLFKYCYECGRSAGVKLTPCTRCYHVSFCSQRCKLKAWTSRHRRECIKLENKQNKATKLPAIKDNKQDTHVKTEQKQIKKRTSISKEIFGKSSSKKGSSKENEVINHSFPRLVNLQHSQI